MKTSRKIFVVLAGLLLAGAVLSSDPIAAGELQSLRGAVGVDESDPVPDVHTVREGQRHERAYRQQPPMIPHKIDKYEVDLKVNQCLRCHDWPDNVKENAPKISETHYVDRSGKRLDQIAGTRWFCTQCHVPQTDARSLVDNKFKPAVGGR